MSMVERTSRPSSSGLWLSVLTTKSWISQRFLGTSVHPVSSWDGIRVEAQGGLPSCPFGVESPSLTCCQNMEKSCSTEEEWEGLEKWTRDGEVPHKLTQV